MDTAKALARDLSRRLRYRPLPRLIGLRIRADTLESVVGDVHSSVTELMPDLRIQGSEIENLALSLAKYGILDLAFNIQSVIWERPDVPGMSLLRDFGFVLSDATIADDLRLFGQDSDPTCLIELQNDINRAHDVLRLFLEEHPRRDMREHMVKLAEKGGMTSEFVDTFLSSYFPRDFIVTDACLTNAQFIWFHKHFWM